MAPAAWPATSGSERRPEAPWSSGSVATLFKLFPPALLGVILMFGGLELAAGVQPDAADKADRYVMLFTAGVAIWNMGAALGGGQPGGGCHLTGHRASR